MKVRIKTHNTTVHVNPSACEFFGPQKAILPTLPWQLVLASVGVVHDVILLSWVLQF
jgi:hypothetical protein